MVNAKGLALLYVWFVQQNEFKVWSEEREERGTICWGQKNLTTPITISPSHHVEWKRVVSPHTKSWFLPFSEKWLANLPSRCVCGKSFSVDHALNCPTGGFPTIRHNQLRDFTAKPWRVCGASTSNTLWWASTLCYSKHGCQSERFLGNTTTMCLLWCQSF